MRSEKEIKARIKYIRQETRLSISSPERFSALVGYDNALEWVLSSPPKTLGAKRKGKGTKK